MAGAKREADPPADGQGQAQQDGSLDNRVSALETGQQSLAGKLDQVIGMLGSKGGDGHDGDPTARANATGTEAGVAHEIRAQLEERDRRAAADADAAAEKSAVEELKARVAELAEKPPEAPVRRVERVMWG